MLPIIVVFYIVHACHINIYACIMHVTISVTCMSSKHLLHVMLRNMHISSTCTIHVKVHACRMAHYMNLCAMCNLYAMCVACMFY